MPTQHCARCGTPFDLAVRMPGALCIECLSGFIKRTNDDREDETPTRPRIDLPVRDPDDNSR